MAPCPKCGRENTIQYDGEWPDEAAVVACDHCGNPAALGKYERARRKAEEKTVREAERVRYKAATEARARMQAERRKARWAERDRQAAEWREADERARRYATGGLVAEIAIFLVAMLALFVAMGASSVEAAVVFGGALVGLAIASLIRDNTRAVNALRREAAEREEAKQRGES